MARRAPDRRPAEDADDPELAARLGRLERELDVLTPAAPQVSEKNPGPKGDAAGLAKGLRMSSELVAGVIVGGVIGWGVDWLTGYRPWGLMIFMLLGFTAGTLNVLRSAGLVTQPKIPDKK
jgi:ATP synthase protein I